MKPINISNKTAKASLNKILDDVQKRSIVRNIYSYDIVETLNGIAARLSIPKCALDGTKVEVDIHAQRFPSAYRGTPESTHFFAENRKGKWFVTDIRRKPVFSPNMAIRLYLSETTKQAIIEKSSAMCI